MSRGRIASGTPPGAARVVPIVMPLVGLLTAAVVAGTVACGPTAHPVPAQVVAGGDARGGAAAMQRYGCGSCHAIPGIRGAAGQAGPALEHYARRTYVAGMLPNTAENLVWWIRKPQDVVPGNAMPNLGMSDREARDMAAYLYTLR